MFSKRIARLAIGLIAFVGVGFSGNVLLAYETVPDVEIRVETEPDGSGELVAEQELKAGDTLTVYAVARYEDGTFLQSVIGADWTLQNVEGEVTQEDLAGNGDGRATFTADGAGSASIQADSDEFDEYGELTPVPSGRITVATEGSGEAQIRVETADDGSGNLVPKQMLVSGDALTLYAVERDESGDFVQLRTDADWSLQDIEGEVTQDDLANNGDGSATFTAGDSGSAIIQADYDELAPAPSGRITVIHEGNLPDDEEDDIFAGTWHGTLSGEGSQTTWDNMGFIMDITNLQIGTLQLDDDNNAFRTMSGTATASYQNPSSKLSDFRAFLDRYTISSSLVGKMKTTGWGGYPVEEISWTINMEHENWLPGGYIEALTDDGRWVRVDNFEEGKLSVYYTTGLRFTDVEPNAGKDVIQISKTNTYVVGWDVDIKGTLYRISDEQNLDFPEDVGSGERITTDQHTRKIINVPEITEITANPGSEAEIRQSEDGQTTDIEQFNGMLRHKIKQLGPGQSYDIRTPQAVTGVRGTTLWTKVNEETEETSVDLQEGKIEVFEGQVKRVDASGSSTVVVDDTGNVEDLSLSDTANSEIGDGATVGTYTVYDDSTLRVAGGSVDQIRSLGAGAVEISAGSLNRLRAEDSSSVDLSGGMLTELQALDSSAVTLYGQNFNLGGDLEWGSNGEILGTGTLSGDWINTPTSFDINIKQNNQGALVRAIEMLAVTFNLGNLGTRTGGGELEQTVASRDSATAPEVNAGEGWIFIGWDKEFSSVAEDLTVNAQYQEDRDGDGLPDEWEQTIVNHSSAHATVEDVDPNDDYDGDGWSNQQEYENGTDPAQYVLELQEGWNLVSIARAPSDYSVNAIFGDNMADAVWCWIDGRYQAAEDVVPTGGHWVLSRDAAEIDIGAMNFPESPDSDGDGLCDSVEEDIGTDPQTYIIPLESGWNLVSLCRVPADNSPEAIFGDKIISPAWEWESGEYRQADELKPLKAYWVYRAGDRITVQMDGLGI